MNVLMIGIGTQVLTGLGGDARERHLEYARQAGSLTMVVSSFRHEKLKPTRLSEHLMVYPTDSVKKPLFLRDAYRLGARICRRGSVDLIVTQDPFATGLVGYLLKRRFSTPLIMSNHSCFLDNEYWLAEKPLQYHLFNRLGKWLIHKADGLRVVNLAEKEKYVSFGILANKIWFLPTPVPISHFLTSPSLATITKLRRDLHLENQRVLLWVGDPNQAFKDLETLFQALSRVIRLEPKVRLLLVGDFSRASGYVDRVEELGLQNYVIFSGRVSHDELPPYYHLCDFYVHSSRYEGLAKVMVEAAACGKAIVSTRIPGIEAIVKEGISGLLVPVGDAYSLAEQILYLLRNPEIVKQMGEAAQDFVISRFTQEAMISGIVNMWKCVIE